eukprot:Nitzschia sp. Nitz4//scaffold77_size91520//80842//81195//NITZ4_004905-RA/size91520-processed-gene-0.101-mRNA-1//1//CDS//3329558036//1484//frame0
MNESNSALADSSDTEDLHPLFMSGLPSDFEANPQLTALASFLEDEVPEEKAAKQMRPWESSLPKMSVKSGGGKIKRNTNAKRSSTRHAPYSAPKRNRPQSSKTTLSEAQLFLKLWKI